MRAPARIDARPDPGRLADAADEATPQRTAGRLRAGGFDVETLDDAEAARARLTERVPPGTSVFGMSVLPWRSARAWPNPSSIDSASRGKARPRWSRSGWVCGWPCRSPDQCRAEANSVP
jgi:hypothetical protein